MFATDDTIVAVATPPGPGGIGIVRVSGARATEVAGAVLAVRASLEPRRATLTEALDPASRRPVDRVLATYFPGPRSYTGEDVVEISGHGNPLIMRQIVGAAVAAGARMADRGEFTFRAFLRGRIDLVQAEAIHDLIAAVTPRQAGMAFDQLEGTATAAIGAVDHALFDLVARIEASLDFPDEGYRFVDAQAAGAEAAALASEVLRLIAESRRGRLVREGCQVVVVGKPNVGKSCLFNALCGAARTIVSAVAGTTRDLVTEQIDLDGIPVTIVDTAGIRTTRDVVEAEGVRRARQAVGVAAAVVVVLDRSRPLDDDDRALLASTPSERRLVVVNKRDLPAAWSPADARETADSPGIVEACLVEGDVAAVREGLRGILDAEGPGREEPAVSNIRHVRLLDTAAKALGRAAAAAADAAAEELVLADLAEAQVAFDEILGKRTPDAVLERIFEQFCIGK